jgi:hypothetical protein
MPFRSSPLNRERYTLVENHCNVVGAGLGTRFVHTDNTQTKPALLYPWGEGGFE